MAPKEQKKNCSIGLPRKRFLKRNKIRKQKKKKKKKKKKKNFLIYL